MSQYVLSSTQRKTLEKVIRQARDVAEAGARDAIRRLGIEDSRAPAHLDEKAKKLRVRLRAHARALGDVFDRTIEQQAVKHLIEATAYAHWHRMLFARFLAERDLLQHPTHGAAVTLSDCEELAETEGLADGWAVAERYAAAMLPAVFLPEDPVWALVFAPEHAQELQELVKKLDKEIFLASDSLGWTYQFWRAAEKDAVNAAGGKIGANELPAVTQLFTEPYMVHFLLHNTLGAWWAGKVLTKNPKLANEAPDELSLRAACKVSDINWDMLRFVKDQSTGSWRPAAGIYEGWPKQTKELTVLDPCCGSGHFLTEALPILAALRQAEEGLTPAAAIAAVLQDNLFGLELDGRCVQIASFAVALNAWRIGGWQALPLPHIAWVGSPPPLPRVGFIALANGNKALAGSMGVLHDLFSQAPLLGSLIDPSSGQYENLFNAADFKQLEGVFDALVQKLKNAEPERAEGAIAARGMADAAHILNRKYSLQITNVPFLSRVRHGAELANYLSRAYPAAKSDLSTAMLSRMLKLAMNEGAIASVSPQNWIYQSYYKKFRKEMLDKATINVIAALGSGAFETISGEVVNAVLTIVQKSVPSFAESKYAALDANEPNSPDAKAQSINADMPLLLNQSDQLKNPEFKISTQDIGGGSLLNKVASFNLGICTGDYERFGRKYWEQLIDGKKWRFQQTTIKKTEEYKGFENALLWEEGDGSLREFISERLGGTVGSWIRGKEAWEKDGILVSAMGDLPVSLYRGELYDSNSVVLIPHEPQNLPAIWAFVSSDLFRVSVRKVSRSLKVQGDLVNVPFDIDHWQKIALEKYPDGLPELYSEDPTQWIFHGHPAKAEKGTSLHVALARFSGYQWPAENDKVMNLSSESRRWISEAEKLPTADADGILCLPTVTGERSLADRLREYLAAAFENDWSDAKERELIAEADARFESRPSRDSSLEAWLRDRAFRQHCKLFHDRPFLWQVWDGTKDGFSAFVHYHRFNRTTLEKLTYTILGDWLSRAKAEGNTARIERGRELQQTLEKILTGEPPYDIFVRWKPLERQPFGWEPDLDDGVRMNIRPFVEANILRDKPNIKWTKDRGTDVPSAPWYGVHNGERINDHHTTLEEKRAARENAAQGTRRAAT